jgi:16S rRNA (cytidine1402-2'-O)-methyltransferase
MKPVFFRGTLYLIPTTLGESTSHDVLPATVNRAITTLDTFIVENEKTARKFIKEVCPAKSQPSLKLFSLNKHTKQEEFQEMIKPLLLGENMGLMSEAGCPGVADPGAVIVQLAHQNGIKVVPLVGPSSILMAIMASGLNGQNFAFNGYLPIDKNDRKNSIRNLEKWSLERNQSQIFIETPYRNNKMLEDLLLHLNNSTLLTIAADITLPTEFIKTTTVQLWRKEKVDLQNRPAIFILLKEQY